MTAGLAVAVAAALWQAVPPPAFAQYPGGCEPGPAYVPGTSLGPVSIGMPLSTVQQLLGRPQSVEDRRLQGHQWTRMRFTGLDVLARDNAVVAANLTQPRSLPLRTRCGTLVTRPFSAPINVIQQSYGPPSSTFWLNGLQYWLYDALGLLVYGAAGAPYAQGLMVYPAGEYCGVAPVLVSFGAFVVQTLTLTSCARPAGDHER